MISKFFTTSFTCSRPTWSEDESGIQSSSLQDVGTFSGHIQQASPELAQSLTLNLTKTFSVWCAVGTNVHEGDTLETSDGKRCVVRAIQKNDVGNNQHLELVVEYDQIVNTSS